MTHGPPIPWHLGLRVLRVLVMAEFGVTAAEQADKKKQGAAARSRYALCWLARETEVASAVSASRVMGMGELLGRRAARQHNDLMGTRPAYSRKCYDILEMFEQWRISSIDGALSCEWL